MQMLHRKNSINVIIYVRKNSILYDIFYDYDGIQLVA